MSQGSHEKSELKEDISSLLERQQSSRLTRKESIVSRFSSIASITSQVAATMAAMSVSEILTVPEGLSDVEPNEIVDKLLNHVTQSMSSRFSILPLSQQTILANNSCENKRG